jgi:hypothetical protein
MSISKTATIGKNASAHSYPVVPKRTWRLTIDNPKASQEEAFFAVQVFTVSGSVDTVCILSGHDGETINPVYVPFSGAIIPVCGIGYMTSGNDIYGNPFTTTAGITVLGLGGDTVNY